MISSRDNRLISKSRIGLENSAFASDDERNSVLEQLISCATITAAAFRMKNESGLIEALRLLSDAVMEFERLHQEA